MELAASVRSLHRASRIALTPISSTILHQLLEAVQQLVGTVCTVLASCPLSMPCETHTTLWQQQHCGNRCTVSNSSRQPLASRHRRRHHHHTSPRPHCCCQTSCPLKTTAAESGIVPRCSYRGPRCCCCCAGCHSPPRTCGGRLPLKSGGAPVRLACC